MFRIQNRPQGQPFLQKEGMKSSSGKFYAISVTHICHFTRHWIAVGNQIHGKLGKKLHFLHIWPILGPYSVKDNTGLQSQAVSRFPQVAIFEVVRLHF